MRHVVFGGYRDHRRDMSMRHWAQFHSNLPLDPRFLQLHSSSAIKIKFTAASAQTAVAGIYSRFDIVYMVTSRGRRTASWACSASAGRLAKLVTTLENMLCEEKNQASRFNSALRTGPGLPCNKTSHVIPRQRKPNDTPKGNTTADHHTPKDATARMNGSASNVSLNG